MYVLCSFKIRAQSANGAESLIVWKRRKKRLEDVDVESLALPETQV